MTNAESALRRAPEIFSPRVAIILLIVGVFSFSAFITLSAFAPELGAGDVRAHALSRSAIGYAGIVKLARATGALVAVSRAQPEFAAHALVVLTPDEPLKLTDVSRFGGSITLVVLPKWIAIPSFDKPGRVIQAPALSEGAVERILQELSPKAEIARDRGSARPIAIDVDDGQTRSMIVGDLLSGKIESLQTISAPNITPVATTRGGRVVLGVIRSDDHHDIYVLSEPDLLNNQGIADAATARAGLGILNALHPPGSAIAFDVTLNGIGRSRNLLRLALQPPLLAATLSLLLVAVLIAWRAATREGPAAAKGRALAYGKRVLADNSAALIRLAGREHTMASRYADFLRNLVAQRIGVAADGNETTSAELDRIARARGLSQGFSGLAADAAAARNRLEALTAARKLHAWTEEMIRATR